MGVPAASGPLVGDYDLNGNSRALVVSSVQVSAANVGVDTTTAQGGGDGVNAVYYLPPIGYEGNDGFSYLVSDGDPITPEGIGMLPSTLRT